jgi:hypothetical protein
MKLRFVTAMGYKISKLIKPALSKQPLQESVLCFRDKHPRKRRMGGRIIRTVDYPNVFMPEGWRPYFGVVGNHLDNSGLAKDNNHTEVTNNAYDTPLRIGRALPSELI